MAEIYIVTQGQYSDYHIIGIYDDREAALMVVDAAECAEVEVRTLNPGATEMRQGLGMFLVHMDADGNNAKVTQRCDGDVEEEYSELRPNKHIMAKCWAWDEQHAIKIINEKRLIALASPGD